MSSDGQTVAAWPIAGATADRAIAIERYDGAEPWRWERHSHERHQLTWGPRGIVVVETDSHNWHVPPTLGLWIPANAPHAIDGVRPAQVYCLYFDVDSCPIQWSTPTAVAVGGFLREVIVRLDEDDLTTLQRERTESVLYDVLTPASSSNIRMPMPADARLRLIANGLIADPADDRSLVEWASAVGASVRTLTRLFSTQTGLTFAQWRRQVRLRTALTLLAHGASVSATARKVGYRNSSAFVHAFHQATGQPPGVYTATASHDAPADDARGPH
ncbi:MAG: helix-turn-helix transcriptional regulator [Ilumatobacteraceae bacterium]